jgi:hypothetical protein
MQQNISGRNLSSLRNNRSTEPNSSGFKKNSRFDSQKQIYKTPLTQLLQRKKCAYSPCQKYIQSCEQSTLYARCIFDNCRSLICDSRTVHGDLKEHCLAQKKPCEHSETNPHTSQIPPAIDKNHIIAHLMMDHDLSLEQAHAIKIKLIELTKQEQYGVITQQEYEIARKQLFDDVVINNTTGASSSNFAPSRSEMSSNWRRT